MGKSLYITVLVQSYGKKSLGLVQSFVSGLKQQIRNIILHNDVEDVLYGGLEVTCITQGNNLVLCMNELKVAKFVRGRY